MRGAGALLLALSLVSVLQQLNMTAVRPADAAAAEPRQPQQQQPPPPPAVAEAAGGSDDEAQEVEELCRHELLTPEEAPTDHTKGKFLLQPAAACAGRLLLLVFVQSALPNRGRRDLIRRTWASVGNVGGDRIATIFVVGRSDSQQEMRHLQQEAEASQDVLQADFADTYRNLTYKQLYAIKWVAQTCRNVRFVMKTDDDVVLNVFHLRDYLRDRLMETRNFIVGHMSESSPFRDEEFVWSVTRDEWPLDTYPRHFKGSGYVMSSEILPRLHLCAKWRKYFWIEDVFVSGCLATALKVTQMPLEAGWDTDEIHPSYIGPKVNEVSVLVSLENVVMPSLHERLWSAMMKYSRWQ